MSIVDRWKKPKASGKATRLIMEQAVPLGFEAIQQNAVKSQNARASRSMIEGMGESGQVKAQSNIHPLPFH